MVRLWVGSGSMATIRGRELDVIMGRGGLFGGVVFILSLLVVLVSVLLTIFKIGCGGAGGGLGAITTRGTTIRRSLDRQRSLFTSRGNDLGNRVSGLGRRISLGERRRDETLTRTGTNGIICLAFSSNPSPGAPEVVSVLGRGKIGTAFFIGGNNGCGKCVGGVARSKGRVTLRSCSRGCPRICTSRRTFFSSLRGVSSLMCGRAKIHAGVFHFPKNDDGAVDHGCSPKVVAALAGRIRRGKCYCFS